MRRPLFDALRSLDPAQDAPDIDSDRMLNRIRQQASTDVAGDVSHLLPRNRSVVARRLAMGAAAFSIVAVLAVVLTVALTPGRAYASWTSTPSTVALTSPAVALCPEVEPGPPEVPVVPVLAEQRGSYTFSVLAGQGVFVECLVSDSGDTPFAMAQGSAPSDPEAFNLQQAPALVLSPGTTWGAEAGEGPITTVVGLAATDVTSVVVTTTDGQSAQATITDGWWSVWFPGEVDLSDDLVITDSSGQLTLSMASLVAPGLG